MAAEQPNFDIVAQGFESIGEQMRLCDNLPVVSQGTAIQRRFDHVDDRFDRVEDLIRQLLQRIDRLQSSVHEVQASDLAR